MHHVMTATGTQILRQHLIDPVMCVRCGGCGEACPNDAISLVDISFVVDPDKCDGNLACIASCQTGAIGHWRFVEGAAPYSLSEQASWHELPSQDAALALPDLGEASSAHVPRAPRSAAVPVLMTNLAANPAAGTVVSNRRATPAFAEADIRHIVVAIEDSRYRVLEGQSVGVIPPGVDRDGHPHRMRLYSVASAREGEGAVAGHLALTVKRIVTDADGAPHHGVCSNHLCDAAPGDRIVLTGPFGDTFLMPQAPSARLLMIATGTGIAPMRGFIEHRRRRAQADPRGMLLFYGGRALEELAYIDELTAMAGPELDLEIALSRAPDRPRTYVQDLLRNRSRDVAGLLADPDGYVFVCGLAGLEKGVLAAFEECCRRHGVDWNDLHQRLVEEGRLHFETY